MDRSKRFLPINHGSENPSLTLSPLRRLSMTVQPVNQEINRVIIQAAAPNPGYGIRVTGIYFSGDKALIFVIPLRPAPNTMYPQVISAVQTTTYLDSSFTPVFPPEYENFLSHFI
ncbi:hypothetical protein [Paenibacillus physcomitrellae]|uniref:PrcB C-terminal domain-containing protein n=1 Tax=Paenibacillus physcomitrellae TaxID=1619311 RepID=A0ABQ1FN13_9BACL|nr:hypothetical protein [Paenibacillus physcomitrellae]GGA20359.1 hypothetical protein GCM10010917_01250 [Paenibacillus physcomitrellae]